MLEAYRKRFSSLPMEAILKTDVLRQGVAFSPDALRLCAAAKPKSYFIFSFDRVRADELTESEKIHVPEEIALVGGPWGLKRTIVSVRINPASPYAIREEQGRLVLQTGDEVLAEIILPAKPVYYEKQLASGKPVIDIAPTIEWGYLIYLTAFRLCQYWGDKEECRFCDINNNYRQQKQQGRPYTGVKTPEEILEALEIIAATGSETMAYTVTGGSVTTELQGKNESQFYAQYAEAIEKKFPGRWIAKAVVQALPRDEVMLLKKAGYRIYHPNYEVWEQKLFETICPGKASYIGWENWMKRIVAAAEIFGPSHVIPNFVAGIEMAKPHGFATVEEALASTGRGLEFFMSRGISPRFTVWCVEPNTVLSQTNSGPPPLDYYLGLLCLYRDTHRKYRLPIPPGYGEAGVGKALFSVSAFMDIL